MSTEPASTEAFDPVTLRQVLLHMNRHHAAENLQLALLAEADLRPSRAWMAGVDRNGVDLVADTAQGPVVLRIDFYWPASTLVRAGEQLRQLYQMAATGQRL